MKQEEGVRLRHSPAQGKVRLPRLHVHPLPPGIPLPTTPRYCCTFVFSGSTTPAVCGTAPHRGKWDSSLGASGRAASGYTVGGGTNPPPAKPRPAAPAPNPPKPGAARAGGGGGAARFDASPLEEVLRLRGRLGAGAAGVLRGGGGSAAASRRTADGRLWRRPDAPPPVLIPPLEAPPPALAPAAAPTEAAEWLKATEAAGEREGARWAREEREEREPAETAASAAAERGWAEEALAVLTTT